MLVVETVLHEVVLVDIVLLQDVEECVEDVVDKVD